ncbi:MAG: hypothetical protein CMI54_07625 [Parcubacteria group bacterium]|jgi:hypothetical protein|nr:hypothetical protein [Parcubacteria group bacterium]|tara:strand:+ start:901 stop:1311 length:411 start_codon:yes stop_codon:yes gene_type:complete
MKILLTILLFLNLYGCGTIEWAKSAYKVNMKDAQASCKTDEIYKLAPFRTTSFAVLRFDECLGINDLFMVLWGGDDGEYNSALADLLMLEYLRLHNTDNDNNNQLGYIYLKTEEPKEGIYARFWQFKKIIVEESEE